MWEFVPVVEEERGFAATQAKNIVEKSEPSGFQQH